MSIYTNFSILNIYNTPGAITDNLDNRPAADINVVAIGTIFIAINTKEIYTFNGTAWLLIGTGNSNTNPTSAFLPYNNEGIFLDSSLRIGNSGNINVLFTNWNNGLDFVGFYLNKDINQYYFGSDNAKIQCVDDPGQKNVCIYSKSGIYYSDLGNNSMIFNSAGAVNNKYLQVNINGNNYKIALRNP